MKSSGTQKLGAPTLLYLVDFGDFKKVGTTQVPIEERFIGDGPFKLIDSCMFPGPEEANEFERLILKSIRPYLVRGSVRRGTNECFVYSCTSLEELL